MWCRLIFHLSSFHFDIRYSYFDVSNFTRTEQSGSTARVLVQYPVCKLYSYNDAGTVECNKYHCPTINNAVFTTRVVHSTMFFWKPQTTSSAFSSSIRLFWTRTPRLPSSLHRSSCPTSTTGSIRCRSGVDSDAISCGHHSPKPFIRSHSSQIFRLTSRVHPHLLHHKEISNRSLPYSQALQLAI